MPKLSINGLISEACPTCREQSKWVVRLRSSTDKSYDVCCCKRCGLIFIPSIQVSMSEQANTYGEEFYERALCADQNPMREVAERQVIETLVKTLKKYIPTPGKMLDVGCGDGIHLKLFHERGWEVSGTEISTYAVQHIRSKYGFEVFAGELQGAPFKSEGFDYIQMRHVIEHLPDPMPTLRKIRELLRHSGIVRIDTPAIGLTDKLMPIVNAILNPIIKTKRFLEGRKMPEVDPDQWGNLHPPEHNLWFTVSAMRQALKNAGFEILLLHATYRGDRHHYPSKFLLSDTKMSWWNRLWVYMDILGAKFGLGSILVVYAKRQA